ncbi:MAG: cytochrome c biogenesis CcdA family protein [Bdellovibrionota bacterium]
MGAPTYILAGLAGALTTLSPCVLPVLPLVVASSGRQGRRGPLFFALGLLLTFVGTTWLLSSFGTVIGLDRDAIRLISGAALLIAGILFLSERAQELLSKLLAPLINKANQASSRLDRGEPSRFEGLRQFALGALTGVIWTPCSGPSLGIAIGLAAERENPLQALVLLCVFGLGAVIPLLAIAYGSKAIVARIQRTSRTSARVVKRVVGILILVIGLAVLSGFDKKLEAVLVGMTPEGLLDFTTRF